MISYWLLRLKLSRSSVQLLEITVHQGKKDLRVLLVYQVSRDRKENMESTETQDLRVVVGTVGP